MRPVEKWTVGTNGVVAIYNPYSGAKPILLKNFGNEPFYYCNYCDRVIPGVNLEVEHIQNISHNPALEFTWTNFLIACKNCNLTKSDQHFAIGNILLPQLQNTWNCFKVNNDGTIEADADNADAYNKASRTVELLGLDRGFFHKARQPQDDRYDARRHVQMIARRTLQRYEEGTHDYLTDIVTLAISHGFWYIWMKVYSNHPVVQEELVKAFKGTYKMCMTANLNRQ